MAQSTLQQLKWGLQLGLGVCLLGAALGACLIPLTTYSPQHLNLDQEGVRATATVTQKHMLKGSGSTPPMRGIGGVAGSAAAGARLARAVENSKNGTTGQPVYDSFEIDYAFTVNGQQLSGYQGLDRSKYDNLRVGSEVAVIYHPANPSVHRLPEYRVPFENSSILNRILIALVCFPLGAFTLYRGAMNAMGRTKVKTEEPTWADRIELPAARGASKKAAPAPSGLPRTEPRRAIRKPGQFGTRARA